MRGNSNLHARLLRSAASQIAKPILPHIALRFTWIWKHWYAANAATSPASTVAGISNPRSRSCQEPTERMRSAVSMRAILRNTFRAGGARLTTLGMSPLLRFCVLRLRMGGRSGRRGGVEGREDGIGCRGRYR